MMLFSLRIENRAKFIFRNNRKVAGEYLIYSRDALPSPCPWVSNEELDAILDCMKLVAVVNVDVKTLEHRLVSGRLPEGVSLYSIMRAVASLDG